MFSFQCHLQNLSKLRLICRNAIHQRLYIVVVVDSFRGRGPVLVLWLHWLTVPNTPASNYLTRKQHSFNQIYLQRMDVKCYIVGYRNNIITKMRPFSEITRFIKPLCLLTRENELLQFVSIVVENLIKGLF